MVRYIASRAHGQLWRCVLVLMAELTVIRIVAALGGAYGQEEASQTHQLQQTTPKEQQLHQQEEQPPLSNTKELLKPHIVFILADDLGFNDVSWHNNAILMPTLDRLAREGVILESSYVQPVCTPTRAALLSGRYPHTIGRQGGALETLQPTGLDPSLPLMAETLQRVGYATHIVGKWHLGFCNWSYTPTRRGFDSFYGFYNSGGNYYTKVARTKFKRNNKTQLVYGYDRRQQRSVHHTENNEYSTFEFANRARTIISQHPRSQPLFLYLPFQAVHGPTDVPKDFEALYAGVEDVRRRRYLGMVSALDRGVRTVVRALKEANLYNNSVIVFSTDNGGSPIAGGYNWPLRGYKHTPYEGGVRGAAFVHSPLLRHQGRVHKGLFHIVDWFPTLARLAGASPPPLADGVDQWDSLNFRGTPPRDTIVMILANDKKVKAMIREADWKLLVGIPPCHGSIRPPEDIQKSNAAFFAHRIGLLTQILKQTNNISSTFEKDWFLNIAEKDDVLVVKPGEGALDLFSNWAEKETVIVKTDEDSRDSDDEYDDLLGDVNYRYSVKGDHTSWRPCEDSVKRVVPLPDDRLEITDFKNNSLQLPTNVQLFNIKDDPNERKDISERHITKVQHLLDLISAELLRAVPADEPLQVARGLPSNFGGNWSPGWC